MKSDPFATALAYRIGQIDTLQRFVFSSPVIYTPDMRAALSLRWLMRIWAQYREDRAITGGRSIFDADCTSQRIAFLALLASALPPKANHLTQAARTTARTSILPLADELRQAEEIIKESKLVLTRVQDLMFDPKSSPDPVQRLTQLLNQCRYTTEMELDAPSASAKSPCWAINLLAAARGYNLTTAALPLPGLVRRRLFRADRDPDQYRHDVQEIILDALHDLAVDFAIIPRAHAAFIEEFPDMRSTSRLSLAWLTVFSCGGLTPAHLARALPCTKAGAAKLLRKLEGKHLVRGQGPYLPYVASRIFVVAFPS